MDKIKPGLEWLFKNRFWVTCTLVSVISLVTWYLAWSAIEKERDSRASKLNQKKSSIANVLSSDVATGDGEETIKVHPNAGTTKGMEDRISSAAEGALEAWKERYEKQRDLMQYSGVLPRHIRDPLANHEPMEKPLEKELLDETQRDTFREEIPKHMPNLAAKIQSSWNFDANGNEVAEGQAEEDDGKGKGRRGGGGGGSGAADDGQPSLAVAKDLVIWDKKNQELWNVKTTRFAGFFGNTDAQNRPTSQQMLALSQDLWILGGIFDVIAKVNEGFTANDLAPIERVDHVLVGADAINDKLGTTAEFSYQPPTTTESGGGKKKGKRLVTKRERRKQRAQNLQRRAEKRTASFDPAASQSPFHGRYVDREFSQLNESEITEVITSKTLSPQSYLAVAKRVPVRIAVKMDERRINEFLAAAANSPFAFEIRQVRVNKHDPSEVKELKPEGGGSAKKDDRGELGIGGGTAADGRSRNSGRDGGDEGFRGEIRTNFDVKVEFVGIVKIYNPVDRALFFPEEQSGAANQN